MKQTLVKLKQPANSFPQNKFLVGTDKTMYLASIEKENQVLNAYVKVTEEQALATAKK